MNGNTHSASSSVSNSLFVGQTGMQSGDLTGMATASTGLMCEGMQSIAGAIGHNGNGCIHAMHLPGLGAELSILNVTFVNYKAGYTVTAAIVTYVNVSRPITF